MNTAKEAYYNTDKIHNLPVRVGMAVEDKAAEDTAAVDKEVQRDLVDTDQLDIVGNLCVSKENFNIADYHNLY